MLVALWLTLQWGILPNLHRWLEPIERQASRALGLPVKIGAIAVRSTGFMPEVELTDVVVHDPASGREALRLPRVDARPSPRSLLTLRPHFTLLSLGAPVLEVRRDPQGHLHVAGIALDAPHDRTDRAHPADWLFEQGEVRVQGATLRWTDERRGAPTLALSNVDLSVRNRHLHEVDLAATPPPVWGDRFTLRASLGGTFVGDVAFIPGDWRAWSGHVEVDLPRADVARLRRYVDLPWRLDAGYGSAKARVEIERGQARTATADVALSDVTLRWAEGLAPWELRRMDGRVTVRHADERTHVALVGFEFALPDGRRWPKGDVALTLHGAPQAPTGGELEAQRMDLTLLAMLASRLPLGAEARGWLESTQPRGHAEHFHLRWDGALEAPTTWHLRADVKGLGLKEQDVPLAADVKAQVLGRPGVEGANLEIEASRDRGSAKLRIERGSATFPGVFERPRIPLDRLDAALRWTVAAPDPKKPDAPRRVEVRVDEASFANGDAQGRLAGTWFNGSTGDERGGAPSRPQPPGLPGVLDLDGSIDRVHAITIARYLPLGLAEPARRYVEQSILDGRVSDARVRVKGDLRGFPFVARPGGRSDGQFRIAGKISDGRMNIAPEHRSADGANPMWPLLEQINGDVAFDASSMQIRRATAVSGGVTLAEVQGDVDFDRPPAMLSIGGKANGSATDMLRWVARSPVERWTDRVLAQTTATGAAELRVALALPLKNLDASTVSGSIVLAGNDLRIRPDVPLLEQARGKVAFTEKGLRIDEASARVYGGDASFGGGTRDDGTIAFTGQGSISAEGFAQARTELGEITNLAAVMRGRTPYKLDLAFLRGQSEFTVTTTLEGMALDLPLPLAKTAEQSLPLRVATTLEPGSGKATRDTLHVEAGPMFTARFLRDLGPKTPKVLAGGVGVGTDAPRPPVGVHAAVKAAALDLDAWRRAAATLGIDLGGTPGAPGATGPRGVVARDAGNSTGNATPGASIPGASTPDKAPAGESGYAPGAITLEVDDLRIDARKLSRVVAGLTQDAQGSWRASLDADQLSGFAEWRPPARGMPPRLQARLARLAVPASASESVDALLSDDAPEQPPALDIVVDDFELRGHKLGRVEIEATHERLANDTLAWSLKKLAVATPEARLTGSGRWVAATDGSKQRRTVVDFKLDLNDSGAYLTRFGLPGVLRGGRGTIGGQISWAGSPITWHSPSLGGKIRLDIDAGQFLKAGPGAARLLGVLNLQSLPRRLLLDFRDVFSEGFAFDAITGDVRVERGVATTNNTRMRGVQALVLMEGKADVPAETQDLRVWVVPEIDAGAASLAYVAINPAVGLGTFLAQLFLRRPLMEASTREFLVRGSWDDPKVERLERKPGDRMPDLDAQTAPASTSPPESPTSATPAPEPRAETTAGR